MASSTEKGAVERNEKDLLGLIEEVKHERISRKQFVYRALGMGLAAGTVGGLLAACGSEEEKATTSAENTIGPTTSPEELYLYNWVDYMTKGVKEDFEKETGIKVVESYFDDNEALLSKLKAGATGYDIIVPSDYMVHIMLKSGLLEPLVLDYIPNLANVDPQFQNPTYDNPDENGGMKYSTPYQWGDTGLALRTDKEGAGVTKWTDIFPPDGDQYKGKIQMLNDERECLGAALLMLGYSINSTSQEEVDAATQRLIEQKPLVRAYDSVNMKRAMVEGMPITMCWNGDCLLAMDSIGDTEILKWVIPEEGFALWVDCFAIPKGFNSKYAAHLFMDYCLRPEVQAKLSNWIWYLPVMIEKAKAAGLDPFVLTTMPAQADIDARGELFNDVGQFSRVYTEAWSQVKSA
jgi:spermidine/putrescine transport system substrate-binding protein